jgi:uncharacterized lipoprotein
MKKSPLVVALPLLAVSALALSGCGMFRSHKQWETAKQESPLEIPPGLDTPATSAALVIPPPGANNPTANGATAPSGDSVGTITDAFVVSDSVDSTYQKVGQALQAGDIGQVSAHDDAAHTYTLTVNSPATAVPVKKPGMFGRLFGRGKNQNDEAVPGGDKPASHEVQLVIATSGSNASEVRAQGVPGAVAKVIDALKAKLGG